MHIKYLGDSYDIVKQSFLHWLNVSNSKDWSAHPMFTHAVTTTQVSQYASLLNVTVISQQVLTATTDRPAYFAPCGSCGHLFLDPSTGLRMLGSRTTKPEDYIREQELVDLVRQRPGYLTTLFDQSIPRGDDAARAHIGKKLLSLQQHGVSGFAYISHACFWVLSDDCALVQTAHAQILQLSRLPASRFTQVLCP